MIIKLILFPLIFAYFFARIADESRISRWIWGALSLAVFWGGFLVTWQFGLPGIWGGMTSQAVLFVIITLIWWSIPRRSTAQILADIEKERQAREDQRLMQRHD